MNLFKSKILKSRRSKLIFIFSLLLFFVITPKSAYALSIIANVTQNAVATLVGYLLSIFIAIIGVFLGLLIKIIVSFSSYNNFIHEPAVQEGWKIVSSFCNMFFILIVLVIAFANILNIDSYRIKSTLPKVIIMAILINFSLMICGLLIDFSQIFMMTFVNTIGTSGGEYVKVFQIDAYFDEITGNRWTGEINLTSSIIGMVGAVFFMLIAFVVLFYVLIIIIMRIVMLWIYSILSPFAFLLSAFPAGKPYASKWWDRFTKELIAGPVLMFFVWLSFYMVGHMKNLSSISGTVECTGPYKLFCPETFLPIVMAIALLIGGLKITQEIGGVTGGLAGKAMNRVQQRGGLSPLGAIRGAGGFVADRIQEKGWGDLNLARVYRGVQTKRAEKKEERYATGMWNANRIMSESGGRFRGALAMTATPGTSWEQIFTAKGLRQRFTGGKRMATQKGKAERELGDLTTRRKTIMSQEEKDNLEERKASLGSQYSESQTALYRASQEFYDAPDEEARGVAKEKLDTIKKENQAIKKELDGVNETLNTKDLDDETAKNLDSSISDKRETLDKYIPLYDFEARAADNKAVQNKASKISDITDPTELLRILKEAINSKKPDKNMIKAITKKMTKEGNDNEFLRELGGGTGYKGLHKFMRKLTKDAGFGEQEAFALGSEIAEINKGTNHWGATSAYVMENGRWKETSDQDHVDIRTTEVGKMHPQDITRKLNRLGFGYHDKENNFHLDVGGIMTLRLLDNARGHKQIEDQLNESAAQHLTSLESTKVLRAMEKQGVISKELIKSIETRARSFAANSNESDLTHENVEEILKEAI